MQSKEMKIIQALNCGNGYYNKTIQFMTNKDLDAYIAEVDPTWSAPKNSMALKIKCLKVLELMTNVKTGLI